MLHSYAIFKIMIEIKLVSKHTNRYNQLDGVNTYILIYEFKSFFQHTSPHVIHLRNLFCKLQKKVKMKKR